VLTTCISAAAAFPTNSALHLSNRIVQSGKPQSSRASDDPDHCQGKLQDHITGNLKSCGPSPTSPQAFEWAVCNSTHLTVAYFGDERCSGQPLFSQRMPVGKCWMHAYGARGLPVRAHCNATGYDLSTYSLAPPKPTNMSCIINQTKGGNSLSITLQASANATLVKQVSFEVLSKESRAFLSSTAPLTSSGIAEAVVASLEANDGLASAEGLRMGARSHGLSDEEGNPAYWSELTEELVNCTLLHEQVEAANEGGDIAEVALSDAESAQSPPSRWIELYRVVSGGKFNDFLDQHNAADLLGSVDWLVVPMPGGPPITRYCVEVLDVTLDGIITAEPDGRSRNSSFANFASCNEGECECMHQVDRSIARLPRKQMEDMCGNRPAHDWLNNTCVCSAKSDWQSSKYVGRTPVPYPYYYYSKALMTAPLEIPQGYPHPWAPDPRGYWYSFPAAARCRPGQALGEGNCTWRREDASALVYLDQVNASGLNHTFSTFNDTYGDEVSTFPTSVGLQNAAILERSFESLPLRLPSCGPARKSSQPTRSSSSSKSAASEKTRSTIEENNKKKNPGKMMETITEGKIHENDPSLARQPPEAEGAQGQEIIIL